MQEQELWKKVEEIINNRSRKNLENDPKKGEIGDLLQLIQDLINTDDIEIRARFTGDSARALQATLLLGQLFWSIDSNSLIVKIFSRGIEELLGEFSDDVSPDKSNHILKPIILQILKQFKEGGSNDYFK